MSLWHAKQGIFVDTRKSYNAIVLSMEFIAATNKIKFIDFEGIR